MKTIKIKFVDMWNEFTPEECIIFQILKNKYNVILTDEPEYLIFGNFGWEHTKYKDCVKIFYTGENLAPDFNVCDYAIGFEYLEYDDRYFRLPNYYEICYKNDLAMCESKHMIKEDILEKKQSFCSFVYSHSVSGTCRDDIFKSISSYKKVSSGGKHLNNIGMSEGIKDKLEFERKHKFSIACENSSHPGYTTEKIVQAFAAQTVPIYWGDPKIKNVFNEKSFICVSDFKSLDELRNYIKIIDKDKDRYLKMLSEPAIVSSFYNQSNTINRLEIFLFNIFDQEISCAFRRNMKFWGNIYQRELLDRIDFYQKYCAYINDWTSKSGYFLFRVKTKLKK